MQIELRVVSNFGRLISARLERHQHLCWRYKLWDDDRYVGDLLFEPLENGVVEFRDIKIQVEYRGAGISTALFFAVRAMWKEKGFRSIKGSVVTRDIAFKERVVSWYQRAGAVLIRKEDPSNPSLAGRFTLIL